MTKRKDKSTSSSSSSSSTSSMAPLKFNAGGRNKSSTSSSSPSDRSGDSNKSLLGERDEPTKPKPTQQQKQKHQKATPSTMQYTNNNVNTRSYNTTLSILQTGIQRKRSPLEIKHWIACVLTLDGRDKFTKVLQYASRLLCWYFKGLATRSVGNGVASISAVTGAGAGSAELYHLLSHRFHSLYKSLVESRKAFRLGRSIIEWDKLRSMGWGEYLRFVLMHPLAGGVAGNSNRIDGDYEVVSGGGIHGGNGGSGIKGREMNGETGMVGMNHNNQEHHFGRYDTHPIEEGDEEGHNDEDGHNHLHDENGNDYINGGNDDDNDDASWNEEDQDDEHNTNNNNQVKKAISRPGRPILPSRISSNVGWGPTTTTTTSPAKSTTTWASPNNTLSNGESSKHDANDDANSQTKHSIVSAHPPPPARTVSEMGRQMYRPFPSRSSSMGSYKQLADEKGNNQDVITTLTTTQPQPQPTTPAWKLIGGTLKLIGLMGFWACDNIAFLTGTGFLDPIHFASSGTTSTLGASSGHDASASTAASTTAATMKSRMKRKTNASEWGCRFYFMASVAGLIVNAKEIVRHGRGALKEARENYKQSLVLLENGEKEETKNEEEQQNQQQDQYHEEQIQQARKTLKRAEGKQFELVLALLKSVCDFMVFSNNPGIDLHLKLRGKKNHEGLHCLGGLISASTVLYNNFPNTE